MTDCCGHDSHKYICIKDLADKVHELELDKQCGLAHWGTSNVSIYQRVKDLEENWGSFFTKIQDLEQQYKTIEGHMHEYLKAAGHQDELNIRVKDLEHAKKFSNLDTLINRISHLENWKEQTPDTALIRESAAQFNQRLSQLENNVKRLLQITDSHTLKDMYGLEQKVKNIEEWKDKRYQNISHLNNRIFELERTLQQDKQALKALEEWKQQHIELCNRNCGEYKLIDKKVWEEIKSATAYINSHGTISGWQLQPGKILTEAIKKVDPELGHNPDTRLEDVKPREKFEAGGHGVYGYSYHNIRYWTDNVETGGTIYNALGNMPTGIIWDTHKFIDKKVWEEIKNEIKHLQSVHIIPGYESIHFDRLKNAVKKAECPND